jgi:hypothetical protein
MLTALPQSGSESPAGVSAHQSEMISEMLQRLEKALLDGAPLFAQQRMLSDLSVYANLLFRSRSICSIRDAEFLQDLSNLELALARNEGSIEPRHLDQIRRWFGAHGALST